MRLLGKRILLGITGSIAAYKSATLIRMLIKEGAEVQVIMTPSAKEFITPLTLSTLTQKKVISEFFDRKDGSWHSHVSLGLWCDLMLIAPATASTIAKMATGIADNMLLTTYLSMKAPTWIAPAMDLDMYSHESTQKNLQILHQRGNHIIEPTKGFLASGIEGKGRMEEPEVITESLCCHFTAHKDKPLSGKRVLITAGPTYESIDPVRFIGNYSTGRMGIELAHSAIEMGAMVNLILGPSVLPPPSSAEVVHVTTAEEMLVASERKFEDADIAIFSAAVADYKPIEYKHNKIKRESVGDNLQIMLKRNTDIAATLGAKRKKNQLLVGFALETTIGLEEAKEKMQRKNLDMIVLNSLLDKGAGFGTKTNKITLLTHNSHPLYYPLKDKREVSRDIMEAIAKMITSKKHR